MTALIICSVIALIGIILFVIGVVDSDSVFLPIAILILLCDGICGFGIFCCVSPVSATETKVEVFCYTKAKALIVIETPQKTETFTDAYTYNTISDSSKIYLHTDYNSYGYELRSHLVIK